MLSSPRPIMGLVVLMGVFWARRKLQKMRYEHIRWKKAANAAGKDGFWQTAFWNLTRALRELGSEHAEPLSPPWAAGPGLSAPRSVEEPTVDEGLSWSGLGGGQHPVVVLGAAEDELGLLLKRAQAALAAAGYARRNKEDWIWSGERRGMNVEVGDGIRWFELQAVKDAGLVLATVPCHPEALRVSVMAYGGLNAWGAALELVELNSKLSQSGLRDGNARLRRLARKAGAMSSRTVASSITSIRRWVSGSVFEGPPKARNTSIGSDLLASSYLVDENSMFDPPMVEDWEKALLKGMNKGWAVLDDVFGAARANRLEEEILHMDHRGVMTPRKPKHATVVPLTGQVLNWDVTERALEPWSLHYLSHSAPLWEMRRWIHEEIVRKVLIPALPGLLENPESVRVRMSAEILTMGAVSELGFDDDGNLMGDEPWAAPMEDDPDGGMFRRVVSLLYVLTPDHAIPGNRKWKPEREGGAIRFYPVLNGSADYGRHEDVALLRDRMILWWSGGPMYERCPLLCQSAMTIRAWVEWSGQGSGLPESLDARLTVERAIAKRFYEAQAEMSRQTIVFYDD